MNTSEITEDIIAYNNRQQPSDSIICDALAQIITQNLLNATNKLWHAHPVWFIEDNPIVGYSKQKAGIRLMFWSGADFEELGLNVLGKKFKDASVFYNDLSEIKESDLKRYLQKANDIQWDYKNIVKRKGKLERLK